MITETEQRELDAIFEASEELGMIDSVRAHLKVWLPGDRWEAFQTGRTAGGGHLTFNLVISYGEGAHRVDYVKGFTVKDDLSHWRDIDRSLGQLEVAHEMRIEVERLIKVCDEARPMRYRVPMRGWNVAKREG